MCSYSMTRGSFIIQRTLEYLEIYSKNFVFPLKLLEKQKNKRLLIIKLRSGVIKDFFLAFKIFHVLLTNFVFAYHMYNTYYMYTCNMYFLVNWNVLLGFSEVWLILSALSEIQPLYNRSHGPHKPKSDEDIALSTHKKQVFLEKEIKSNDTLQSVALEFNVPVAELKRINKIHKDNEIYARKIIKVPSNPLSILLDKEYFNKIEEPVEKNIQLAQERCYAIVETVNNSTCITRISSENDTLEQDEFSHSSLHTNELQESSSLLTPIVEHKTNDVMTCSGADWGIPWHALLVFILVIGIGGPAMYVFWLLWSKREKLEGS